MASFRKYRNQIHIAQRGDHAGLAAVRYRPAKGAKQLTGYLPPDEPLLNAFTTYERRCWADGVVPEAPQAHFATQVESYLAPRHRRRAAVNDSLQKEPLPTARQWVGSNKELGPHFQCSTKPIRNGKAIDDHLTLVMWPQCEAITTVPMDQVTGVMAATCFHQFLACPTCVARVDHAGLTPGADVPWAELVPRYEGAVWDGQCDDHRTKNVKGTYQRDFGQIRSWWTALASQKAITKFGDDHKVTNPFPKITDVLDHREVIFKSGSQSSQVSEEELLRQALTYGQVLDICNAHPPHLEIAYEVACWAFSRAGAELNGLRIRDFAPDNPAAVQNPNISCGGEIRVHSFLVERTTKTMNRLGTNVRFYRRPYGKTDLAHREVPLAADVIAKCVNHIRTYRSTPQAGCPGCDRGHRHWPTDKHDTNPHIWDDTQDENAIRCPMAAEAPMFTADPEGRQHLVTKDYKYDVFEPACIAVGLTKERLGFTPSPRHARSIGTSWALSQENPDVSQIVNWGGWANEDMIRKHYDRRRKEHGRIAAERVYAEVTGALSDQMTVEGLRLVIIRKDEEIERLQRICQQNGIDPDSPAWKVVRPTDHKRSTAATFDVHTVVPLVRNLVDTNRLGKQAVLEGLGHSNHGSASAKRFWQAWEEQLPPIPWNIKGSSDRKRSAYLSTLLPALDALEASASPPPEPDPAAINRLDLAGIQAAVERLGDELARNRLLAEMGILRACSHEARAFWADWHAARLPLLPQGLSNRADLGQRRAVRIAILDALDRLGKDDACERPHRAA